MIVIQKLIYSSFLVVVEQTRMNQPSTSLTWRDTIDILLEQTRPYEMCCEPTRRASYESWYRYFFNYTKQESSEDLRSWLLYEVAPYLYEHRGVVHRDQIEMIADVLLCPLRRSRVEKDDFILKSNRLV